MYVVKSWSPHTVRWLAPVMASDEYASRCTAESGCERLQRGLKIGAVTALCCSPVSVHNNGVEYPVTLDRSAREASVWLAAAGSGWVGVRERMGGR